MVPTSDKSAALPTKSRGRLYKGYRLVNHGYYPPDRCVWWEAENLKTGEADFRAQTRRQLKEELDASVNDHVQKLDTNQMGR